MPVGVKRKRVEADARSEDDFSEFEDSDVEEMLQPVSGSSKKQRADRDSGAGEHEYVNNVKGLQRAIETVAVDVPWIERLEVVSAEPFTADFRDDLKTELALYVEHTRVFVSHAQCIHAYSYLNCDSLCVCSYGQALAAVTAARSELERLGTPHRRPDDYFAQMLKSDEHMQKVGFVSMSRCVTLCLHACLHNLMRARVRVCADQGSVVAGAEEDQCSGSTEEIQGEWQVC